MSRKVKKGVSQVKAKKPIKFVFGLIFILGAAVLLFPLVSQYIHYQASKVDVGTFKQEVQNLTSEEVMQRLSLARAYNDGLYHQGNHAAQFEDPYSEAEIEEGVKEYARMLEVNEQMGFLSIPKLTLELPVYAGTNESVLQRGVGHLEGTSLPVGGNNTHSVLTAHRGLPNARLFTDLDKLAVGDYFYFHNLGETLAYQVDQIDVIEPHEIERVAIVPGHDYMTLLTCTPYMINSHRLLVRGHQVPYDQAVEEQQTTEHRSNNRYRLLFYVTLSLLVVSVLFNIKERLKRNKAMNL